jgi:hypothetical protein
MVKWLKDFLREYIPWTLVDQLIYTQTGRAFLATVAGATGTFVARALVEAAWLRNYLLIAFAVFLFIAVVLGVWEGLAAYKRSRERAPKSRYISGDVGFFDSMVNMESAHKAFLNVMDKIARTQNELAVRIKSCTADMETIKRSGRDVFPRMRKVAQRAAKSTNNAATDYEKHLPEMAGSVSFYFGGQLLLIGRTDPANAEQRAFLQNLKEIVGNLRKNTADSRTAQRDYLKALEGLRGFSQELNSALGRMAEKVINTIAVLDDVEGRCDAMITAIDSKLTAESSLRDTENNSS